MSGKDSEEQPRWHSRLASFNQAYAQLDRCVMTARSRDLNEMESQGLIKAFEYTHELAWNVMKDYLFHQGNSKIAGSRDATREAFASGLIEDGDQWMEMIASRNLTTHTYDLKTAARVIEKIIGVYHGHFSRFKLRMESLRAGS